MPPELRSPDQPLLPRVTRNGSVTASGQPPTWTTEGAGGSRLLRRQPPGGRERAGAQSLRRPAAPGPAPAKLELPALLLRASRASSSGAPRQSHRRQPRSLAWPPASFESSRPRLGRSRRQFPAINPERINQVTESPASLRAPLRGFGDVAGVCPPCPDFWRRAPQPTTPAAPPVCIFCSK